MYPERCIEAQIRAARAAGASVRWGIVTSVAQRRDVAVVIVDGKELEADQVIVAAGPWSGRLLGAPFNTLLSVFPQTLHWFPADAVTFGPDRFPTIIWIHGDRERDYFYCFPVLAGSGELKAATEQYQQTVDPDDVGRAIGPVEQAAMYRDHIAGRLVGVLPDPVRSARCLYTVTPD